MRSIAAYAVSSISDRRRPQIRGPLNESSLCATGSRSPRLWGIDEDDLVEVLRGIGPTADLALRDALSRWWATGGEPTGEGFAAVGLRVRQ